MAPSYKEQILQLRYLAETQATALSQYKKELEESKVATYSLYRGLYLLKNQFNEWDQLDRTEDVETLDMPSPDDVNKLNSIHQADIGITFVSALIRSLERTNYELVEIGHSTSGITLDINDVWKTEQMTVPSPLTRSLAMIEKALADVNSNARKARDSIVEENIRQADILIQQMEEDISATKQETTDTPPVMTKPAMMTPPTSPKGGDANITKPQREKATVLKGKNSSFPKKK